MSGATDAVLVLNSGSSTLKLAVVDPRTGARSATGLGERLGSGGATQFRLRVGDVQHDVAAEATHVGAVEAALGALPDELRSSVFGVGHRVVHGGPLFTDSVRVDGDVLTRLEQLVDLAPLHLPANLGGIRAVARTLPGVPQVAVFDTGFHHTLPPRAYRYAVPRAWYAEHGARRYGFHGISVRYVSARAAELLGEPLEELRLVVAHLGNGCSATAVRGGSSVDTTMGFTPLEGLVMGTRSGDVDPGLLAYLAPRLGLDLDGVVHVLNTGSGLAGLSGLGSDLRAVEQAAARGDVDAVLAIEVFCYRLAKAVAALAVPLGRLDALVFTGGIGENSALVRAQVLAQLRVLGDVTSLVVPTDEEVVVARDTAALLGR